MTCYKNGNCMMNVKSYTGVNFCVSPTCINVQKQKRSICDTIAKLLKEDFLSNAQENLLIRLKNEYATILKLGG